MKAPRGRGVADHDQLGIRICRRVRLLALEHATRVCLHGSLQVAVHGAGGDDFVGVDVSEDEPCVTGVCRETTGKRHGVSAAWSPVDTDEDVSEHGMPPGAWKTPSISGAKRVGIGFQPGSDRGRYGTRVGRADRQRKDRLRIRSTPPAGPRCERMRGPSRTQRAAHDDRPHTAGAHDDRRGRHRRPRGAHGAPRCSTRTPAPRSARRIEQADIAFWSSA